MTHMRFGAFCAPPAAWLALIARKPHLAMRSFQPGRIELNQSRRHGLSEVQDQVNNSILYTPDAVGQNRWGVLGWRKVWSLTGRRWIRVGDCDDYAVAKLERLLGMGFGGALRLVLCRYGATAHLVLAVDGTTDTLILDNRQAGIWPWDDPRFSGYRWIAASVPGRLRWARVQVPTTLKDLLARRVVT